MTENIVGEEIFITKKGMTKNATGNVVCFDDNANKWQISFGPVYVGWYVRSEFQLVKSPQPTYPF